MTNVLLEVLDAAKPKLSEILAIIGRHPNAFDRQLEEQFSVVASLESRFDHWRLLTDARTAAREFIEGLEHDADEGGRVVYGASRVRFDVARVLGVQAYLGAQWSLADQVTGAACTMLAARDGQQDEKADAPGLVSRFINRNEAKSGAAAVAFYSIKGSFGWPVGLSYALRNLFIHPRFRSGPPTSGEEPNSRVAAACTG